MNIATDWNKLDSCIYFFENKIRDIIGENKDEEPDVELIIQAETEHLRTENESLKKREIPAYLIEDGEKYLCPKCRMEIMDAAAKYCSNCGHRIVIRNTEERTKLR